MTKYRSITCKGHPHTSKRGIIREHILVMEKKLGRYLNPGEEVHHIDFNGMNNDPDNLQLVTHSEHTRLHKLGVPAPGISRALKGKPKSPEHRKNIGLGQLGNKRSEEAIRHMVEGKRKAREAKKLMAETSCLLYPEEHNTDQSH